MAAPTPKTPAPTCPACEGALVIWATVICLGGRVLIDRVKVLCEGCGATIEWDAHPARDWWETVEADGFDPVQALDAFARVAGWLKERIA
jgi:hypothetical protein